MNFIITVAWVCCDKLIYKHLERKNLFGLFFTLKRIKGHSSRPDSLNSKIKMLQFDWHAFFYLLLLFLYIKTLLLFIVTNIIDTWFFFLPILYPPKKLSAYIKAKTRATKDFGFLTGFKLVSLSYWRNGSPWDTVCCKGCAKVCLCLKNGISNYTQGSHVRAHMLEKCTPWSGRISSSQCWPLSACRHTCSIQPQGSVIAGWDWAWNRLILFTCPADWHPHKHTGRSARMKLHRLQVQHRQLGTIILRHNVGK